jgi:catechol 2,3-dioxygenase-like lactoylglutathione lyase family enzyme
MGQPNVDIVIDCHDMEALIDFWAAALGYRKIGIKDNYGLLLPDDPSHPPVLLQRVPEPKTSKTRVHFDIRVNDVEAKAKELEALGAQRIDVGQPADANFIPMADPEGTEFCVCPGVPPPGKPDRRQIGLRDHVAVEGDVYAGGAVQCGCRAGGDEMPGVVGCSGIACPDPSEVVAQDAGRMEGGVPTEGLEVGAGVGSLVAVREAPGQSRGPCVDDWPERRGHGQGWVAQ